METILTFILFIGLCSLLGIAAGQALHPAFYESHTWNWRAWAILIFAFLATNIGERLFDETHPWMVFFTGMGTVVLVIVCTLLFLRHRNRLGTFAATKSLETNRR